MIESTPTLCGFSPDVIPWQRQVIDLVNKYNYEYGNLEILLSGSVGSAKSVLLAHLAVVHCLEHSGAAVAICRRALPDLKKTIWAEILNHIALDMTEGEDYDINRAEMTIKFLKTGSIIYGLSWADKRYMKFRSLALSMLIIEEIVENDDDDFEAFKQLKQRLRRLPWIEQNVLIAATNPDEPTHWVYNYFILPNLNVQHENRYVFYSRTEDNPFLDPVYIEQLRRDLSEKEVQRFLEGKWLSLVGETIYYEYSSQDQYFPNTEYRLQPGPIHICWDFNIGAGKPMSSCLMQYTEPDTFHVFAESVSLGSRTLNVLEDYESRGLIFRDRTYVIQGDRNGSNRDTRGSQSDYDIIKAWFDERRVNWVYQVPASNPALRERHNRVNAYCKNSEGKRRLFLYKGCKVTDEGLRLTKLKDVSSYVEDDSKAYQHITTALGYGIMSTLLYNKRQPQGTTRL
jgi:hypothetical protein